MSIIQVKNITMQFKEVTALNDVTITFDENKIYGLLGRNGAGKSTLLNLMTNKIFPTSGEILVDSENVLENDNALGKIFCMCDKDLYPKEYTVKKAIKWSKEFYADFDTEYAYKLCDKFQLSPKKKLKGLSTGYNSIFKIILALAANTSIVLFDEPILGLDANHRDMFYKELINNYSENPRTIIISTHLIEEVSDVIEDVVIIKDGKKIMQDSVENILSRGYSVSGSAQKIDEFIRDKEVIGVDTLGVFKTAHIMGSIEKSGIPDDIEITKLDLQKLFIQLTNA